MQMRKSTLKKRQKLKRWRVDEAERYTEAAPDGGNNSKGSYTKSGKSMCKAAQGVCRVCKKREQAKKEMSALLRLVTDYGNREGP